MADKVYYDESCYVCSLEINTIRSRGEACGIEFIDISADDFDGDGIPNLQEYLIDVVVGAITLLRIYQFCLNSLIDKTFC